VIGPVRWSQRWADEEFQGDAEVDVRSHLTGVLGEAQPLHVQLELGFEEPCHELGAHLLVDKALGGQRTGGNLELGVEEFVDGGPQDQLEVGLQIAGVRDLVRRSLGRSDP
jgi:hypothetical protein